MRSGVFDLIVVGGGYRAVSFLANQPWLLDRRIAVVDRRESIGPGAFADYDCVSTSVANRFVAGVSSRVAAGLADRSRLHALQAEGSDPLHLTQVATVMGDIGQSIASDLSGRGLVRTGCVVERVQVLADHVEVSSIDRECLPARHVLVSTGREERWHPALAPWRSKVLLSSEFISVGRTKDTLKLMDGLCGPVVISGGSHSAVAALLRALRLRSMVSREDLEVVVLTRSLARLHYSSLREAFLKHDASREQAVDPVADVCPGTGQVNRDSGLRGVGRLTYLRLAAGEIPAARVERVADLADAGPLLDSAGLVIQALGYHGVAPEIVLPDGSVRAADSSHRLVGLADGTAVIGGQPVERLSVLRVEPTPVAVRDHGLYGQGMNDALGKRLRLALGERS